MRCRRPFPGQSKGSNLQDRNGLLQLPRGRAGRGTKTVDRVWNVGAAIFVHFAQLPIFTQWSVAVLLAAGLVVHLAFNEHTAYDGPSIFTTAGIFFTFIGIAEGLFGFDTAHLESSVPSLLSGLKTAFIASVFGVGVALSLKLRLATFGVPTAKSGQRVYGATIDDLAHQLDGIRSALIGAEEGTLVSQLKLVRQDSNDRLDALKKSQSEFMERMAENNSKALIEALKDVIRDFNSKISEQFGENFKQLNVAVGQLLVWQEQYRDQLNVLIGHQENTAENMKRATDQYAEVLVRSESLVAVSEKLEVMLGALDSQRADLSNSLTSLANLIATASDGLPKIEQRISNLTQQLSDAVAQNLAQMKTGIQAGIASIQETVAEMQQSSGRLSEAIRNIVDETAKAIRANADSVHDSMVGAKALLVDSISGANKDLNEHVKQLSEKTNEHIKKLDVALEKEISHSITTLASQLTALSKQFVDDYGPLTSNLRDIVRAAKNGQ
jgi:hypothetical protein